MNFIDVLFVFQYYSGSSLLSHLERNNYNASHLNGSSDNLPPGCVQYLVPGKHANFKMEHQVIIILCIFIASLRQELQYICLHVTVMKRFVAHDKRGSCFLNFFMPPAHLSDQIASMGNFPCYQLFVVATSFLPWSLE